MLKVLVIISPKFCCRKMHVAMQKLFMNKGKKEKSIEKMDKCPIE
jgi:hypothetical protein